MTKPDGIPNDASATSPSPSSWGTWEDLLLAFAVNRHGSHSWDSIASELQKRISDPVHPITPQYCRLKYLDLNRRFRHDPKSDAHIHPPLLDQLRNLRLAQLRQELHRYDLNIESLELKMKRMEEERDRCLRTEGNHSDLNKDEDKTRSQPVTTAEPIAAEDLDKDQLSVNESNSTDPDAEKLRTSQKDDSQPDRRAAKEEGLGLGLGLGHGDKPTELKSEPDQKSAREDSCNGSSNSIEKKSERKAGLGEMEGEEADVQSSASRSRKEEPEVEEEGGSDKVRRGNRSGDEREHDDQSLAVKQCSTEESQSLLAFLHTIRAHNFGTLFERRLRTQESSKYQKLILQHIDLGIIETGLKEGLYSGSNSKFFRDLLLLVNNALVFFDKNSAEVNAATEVRWLISKEMSQKQAKSDSSSGKHVSLQSLSMTKKEEAEPSRSLVLKPLMVCRKRSSIAAKAATSSDKKKGESSLVAPEEKDAKPQRSQSNTGEEPKITKKRTRDGFPSVAAANTKKNGKNQAGSKNAVVLEAGKGVSCSSSQPMEGKGENKKNTSSSDSKKRGAANFLNRMKQGCPSNSSVLLDALKNTPLTSESSSGKGGSEQQKKSENAKRGEKKEAASRKSRETKTMTTTTMTAGKEKGSPAKRNVGRPPKRGATIGGKRNREGGEAEMRNPGSKQGKKRARKL